MPDPTALESDGSQTFLDNLHGGAKLVRAGLALLFVLLASSLTAAGSLGPTDNYFANFLVWCALAVAGLVAVVIVGMRMRHNRRASPNDEPPCAEDILMVGASGLGGLWLLSYAPKLFDGAFE